VKHTSTTFRAIETSPIQIVLTCEQGIDIGDLDKTVNEVIKAIGLLVGEPQIEVRRVVNGGKTYFVLGPKIPNYEETPIE
jgi:hypothetical protein